MARKSIYWCLLGVLVLIVGCSQQSVLDFEIVLPATKIIVKNQAGWQNIYPSWHPDGKQIVYVVQDTTGVVKGSIIRTARVDTNKQTTLFNDPTFASFPKFSPDGTQLLFTSNRTGSRDVWSYHMDDGDYIQISRESGREDFPQWSPDGDSIAYISAGRIAFTDRLGSAPVYAQNISAVVWSFCWSDDGQSLVFSCYRDGMEQLLRYDVRTKEVLDIAADPLIGNWPAYARQNEAKIGGYIAYQSGNGISLYKILTNSFTTIVDSGFFPDWSPDGLRLIYMKDYNIVMESIWILMNE